MLQLNSRSSAMIKHIVYIFIAIVVFLPELSIAQQKESMPLLHLGTSANSYRGDLGSFEKWTIGFHAGLLLNRKKRLNGSFQFGFGKVTGQTIDEDYPGDPDKTPNTFFRTNFITVNYELHYNFIKNEQMRFYLGQGFGIIHYTPKDDAGDKLQDQDNTRAEGESYGNISVILPTKLGYIYILPNKIGLGFEAGIYNTLTDYIDNISQWGTKSGNDNILYFKFSVNVPVNI